MLISLAQILPVITLLLDLLALFISLYLKSTNILLIQLLAVSFHLLGVFCSSLSATYFMQLCAPFMIVAVSFLIFANNLAKFVSLAFALSLFALLAFACIHSSALLEASANFSFVYSFGIFALIMAGLCAYFKNFRLLWLYVAALWQYFFKDYFIADYCGFSGLLLIVIFIFDWRKYGRHLHR